MSTAIKAIVAIIALGGAGFAGATWYAGQKVDGKFDKLSDQLHHYQIVNVVKRDFQRGFWRSTETVTYRIGCEGAPATGAHPFPMAELTIRNTIHHNPLAMSIDSEIVYSKEAQEGVDKIFKGKQPLAVHTAIGLSGDIVTEVTSPAVSYTEAGQGTFDWKGFTGTVKYDQDLSRIQSKLNIAGFDVKHPEKNDTLHFGAVNFEGEQTKAPEGIYVGKQAMTWDGFGAKMITPQGRPLDFSVGKTALRSDTSIKDGLVALVANVDVDSVIVHDKKVGSLAMDYQADRIDAKAIKAYNDLTWEQGFLQCQLDPKQNQEQIKTMVVALLKQDPSLKMGLKLKTPAGDGTYQLDVASKDVKQEDFGNPAALLPKVNATVAVQVPHELINYMITEFTPESAAGSQAMVDAVLEQGTAKGFVENDGKLIKAKLVLKGGQMELNGKPTSIAQLMAQR
ncbi:YdgA family protein [Andreprevotia chitinilytica]|uniref:YdgA family protein n=1 Tax=Andreprevotia chitinilytica TaxID=396808 RepID=UPI0005548B4A|nr:YdgA family protein [Andreprevotia chitinilytica]